MSLRLSLRARDTFFRKRRAKRSLVTSSTSSSAGPCRGGPPWPPPSRQCTVAPIRGGHRGPPSHGSNESMSSRQGTPDKTWNASFYDDKSAFVWKHGRGVVELLAPQPGERILDLGCGTGHLTNQIAEVGAEVVGMDISQSMIEEARRLYPRIRFEIADGVDFHFDQPFDAVFSNAAIHWMKDQPAVTRCIWNALKPGGRFVAEFGGKGNIRAIRTALTNAVNATGQTVSFEPFARYYPTIGEYAKLLEAQGFLVIFATHFERPTKLE